MKTIKISEILAKAYNEELACQDFVGLTKSIEFIDTIQSYGIASYWTSINVANITSQLNEHRDIAKLLIGASERFIILLHQEYNESLEPGDEVTGSDLSAKWWEDTVSSIAEIRSSLTIATTISEHMAAELTYDTEELHKLVKTDHWLLTFYLAIVNGVFANIAEIEQQRVEDGL